MPTLDQWDGDVSTRVADLRDELERLVDALDAALAIRDVFALTDAHDRESLTWQDLLDRQPDETARAHLAALGDRMTAYTIHKEPRP